MFTGVTIDNSSEANARKTVDFTGGNFKGTYRRNAWNVENKSILLLGTNNTLYWPKPADDQHPAIGACRAYFYLGTYEAREFVLNFGEENIATSISEKFIVNSEKLATAAEWYDLQGRKLEKRPTKAGLYIYGGRKVLVRNKR